MNERERVDERERKREREERERQRNDKQEYMGARELDYSDLQIFDL